jgi:hypothetical protein
MTIADITRRWFENRHSHDRDSLSPPRSRNRQLSRGIESLEDRNLMAANILAAMNVTNDWGSGFQGAIQITNQQGSAVSGWQLEFDYDRNLTSIWDASIVSHVGSHYVIKGAAWDSDIGANSSVTFGFVAAGSSTGTAPANYKVNGSSLGGQGATLPSLSISDASLVEGNSGTSNMVFTVSLSAALTSSVTVKYATAGGTATSGIDFIAASGTLTFAAGQTNKQISVAIQGDTLVEPDETFTLTLSGAVGATLGNSVATGTIKNDDVQQTSGNFVFNVVSDWGSGFTGGITIKNTSNQAVTNWQLEFDFAGQIGDIWDAKVVSHVGNHYVLTNAGWNANIAAGGTASFGFVASPGNVTATPSNYKLTSGAAGGSSGGGGGVTNRAPTPAVDLALVNPGQATVVNVLANDTDPDGDALSIASFTQAGHGTLVKNSNGTFTYTPTAGYTGTDTFSYTVSDGRGGTGSAVVTLLVGTQAATSTWPAQVYAPYVDMTLYPTYNLVNAMQTAGTKYFSLAFITADSAKQPAWGGYTEYEVNGQAYDTAMRQQISQVRVAGGDVVVSFGGAAGRELAEVITDVSQLTAAYQKVISAYNLTHVDFDIEGAAVADKASIDRRSQAIASLQATARAEGRTLEVSFTLPALPTGLTSDGLYVLQSAVRYGVTIGCVNIMAMDYGDSAAPNPSGKMGDYAIQAAKSLYGQLQGLYGNTKTSAQLWSMVGVTPMIGVNDVTTEVFDQQEARELLAFAEQNGIGRLSMWSLNRDVAGTAMTYTSPTASSVNQSAFEFSKILGTI